MNFDPVASAVRGEATIVMRGNPRVLRPTFAALVAAEEELGPVFPRWNEPAGASCGWPNSLRYSGTAYLPAMMEA